MNYQKLPQRLLAIAMSVILLLGMMPIAAAANTVVVNTDEETVYEDIVDEVSTNEEISNEEISNEEISNEEIVDEAVTEMESVQRITNTVGSIYTVSNSSSTEANIAWTDLAEKLGDGTIKSGDTLQITETTTLVGRITIPAAITELTIEGNSAIKQALAIQCNANNMRLILRDISLSAYLEPNIMFGSTSELVIEGLVELESNARVIQTTMDLTISGSGNLNVNGIERTNIGMEAVLANNVIIDSTGTLTFRGGNGQQDGGVGIYCNGNFTLNSGTVYVYGGHGGRNGGTGNGAIALRCINFTISNVSELEAVGGDGSNALGGNGIYCVSNLTLEAGRVFAGGGVGGTLIGDGANAVQCSNLTLRGSSNMYVDGGGSYNGITGNGINCTNFTFDSSGEFTAEGGGVYTFNRNSSKAIKSTYPIKVSGSGSIIFIDGGGQIPTPFNTVSFSTDLEGKWNVDPSDKLVTGGLSDKSIIVKSSYDGFTTVKFEGKTKPVISIISQPKDLEVTEGLISGNVSVWTSATDNIARNYQWFSSEDGSNNGTAVSGATSDVFYIPNNLSVGNYYYYCEISALGADNIKTNVVKVTVLPRGPFSGGDGSQDSPYLISSAEELKNFAELINNSADNANYNTKYYILTNNIDLSQYANNSGWVPIGNTDTYSFKGHFDGKGHKITGLTINRIQDNFQGLFGIVYNGTIQNLGVKDVNIRGYSAVGGIAGYINSSSTVQNCYVTGSISGGAVVGGLVGVTSPPFTINNCYTSVTVSGITNIGGVIGTLSGGTVKNCYALGDVNGAIPGQNVGGVAGFITGSGTLENCAALNSSVSGQNLVGRVCGRIDNSTVTGNVAAANMVLKVNGVTPEIIGDDTDKVNGVSRTILQLCEEAGFPITLTQSPWDYSGGNFPRLNDTTGALIAGQELIPVIAAVTNITAVPTTATAGTNLTLTGTVAPANATFKTITWSIKNPGTTEATCAGNVLSPKAAGTVIVTATIENGISAYTHYTKDFTITVDEAPPVINAVTSITGVPTTATAGTDVTLTGTVVPANATNKTIVWSIQNAGTTGATTNGNVLSTTAAGTVVVTATIVDGISIEMPYTQEFTITVNEAPPVIKEVTNITGVPTTATAGTSVTLTGTVVPANATYKTIVWSIKNPGTTGATRTGNVLSTTAAGIVVVTATIIDGISIERPYTQDFTITITAASNGGNGSNPNESEPTPSITPTPTPEPTATPTPSITPVPSTGTQQITVDVKQGNTNDVASQITIERTTNDNGEKSDKVTYDKEKATETVQKLKAEGKDTARIVIPEAKDEVSETNIYIPATSLGTLAKGKINLQIDTEEAKINLSKDSVNNASKLMADDLYFRLVPVKNEAEKKAVSDQAKRNAVLVSNNENVTASVIGNPITIETNMPSADTVITLPLTGIVIPTKSTEKEALLKQLAVYIEHSDGDKELVQGELVEYKKGQYGISFHITKFSIFTVVKTDAFLKSTEKEITKITVPTNAVIKGSNITATVANEISSITVKVKVSDKAAWKLYFDKDLKKEAVNGKLKLTTGVNTSYIKVTAQDKSTKLYKLTITRNKSSISEITKVMINENTVIKGSTITATVDNEKTSLTVKAQVSNNASYKLYSDKSLKKEISNHKLNLTEGINTVYLKVTAENGKSTKVYTIKITRKAQDYKSDIRLGLIGSEKYANIVARIFKQEYDTANVKVTSKGKYYLITMSFKDKAAAKKACKDMIRRQYIVNYYFN